MCWEVPLGGVRSEWTLVDKVPGFTKRDVEPNEREQTKDDQGLEGCGVYTAPVDGSINVL